jgi:CheY-like chemotaxis protein
MAGDQKLGILVVDDEAEIRDMLAFFMGFWGHEVRMASSGKEALQIAEDFGPHLILMDIQMPEMNGWEAVRRLREEPKFRKTFCVALTGLQSDEDKSRSLEAGFDLHLVKPVDGGDLKAVIEKAVMNADTLAKP